MVLAPSTMKTEQSSGALKSFMQHLRARFAKQKESFCDHEASTIEWDALDTALLSQEASDQRTAIAQILQNADPSTKKSITDWLLFTDDIDEAIGAMISRDQHRRKAA